MLKSKVQKAKTIKDLSNKKGLILKYFFMLDSCIVSSIEGRSFDENDEWVKDYNPPGQ